ncbi:hypothetical protein N7519_011535 [Penicillium mononematosum]|uniref:uncharacterized protein n=1 Tax=Penicillium mononematosum TaxID=268346 RepID=UPI002546C7C1|nr:uncharacterized protein N7519_011535 [Penicillium mononematosum]KAJ6181074.1 hypothetical protein N7519_011535 [Penicillium mononematosum]
MSKTLTTSSKDTPGTSPDLIHIFIKEVHFPQYSSFSAFLRGEVQDLAARTEQFHVDFLKFVRSGVFDSEINVGTHGDDKGRGPEMIGRNIGKKGMGGPGINVGNHSDEECDEDSYRIAHWGQRKKKKVYGPDEFVATQGVPIQGIGYPSSPFTVVLRLGRFLD